MSKRRANGDTGDSAVTTADPAVWSEKKKPQPRMVQDTQTGEMRLENKEEKFRRLATARVRNAVKRMRQLVPMGNRSQYEYSEEQADKVIEALTTAVEAVRAAFQGFPEVDDGFSL